MRLLEFILFGCCITAALAENATGQSDSTAPKPVRSPQALSLLGQSLAAVAKGRPIQDITVEAQITRTAGSDTETGTAVLETGGYDKGKTTLALSSGPRKEMRNGAAGVWSRADQQNQPIAMHNCWTAAAWFAPAVVIQAWMQDSSFDVAYVGIEDREGAKVHHIAASRNLAGVPAIAALSAMDLYLDAQSLLPLALAFNTHPDADLGLDLPVQVTFAGYQEFGGVLAPSRIQTYLQNTLLLDIYVTTTSVNSGLAASTFMLQ